MGGTDDGCRLAPLRARGRVDVSSFSGRSRFPWRFALCQDLRADRDFGANRSPFPQGHVSSGAPVPAGAPRPAFCLSRSEDDPSRSSDARRPPFVIFRRGAVDAIPLASRGEAFGARLSSMAPDCSWADDLHLTERTLEVAAFESLKCFRLETPEGRDSWRATRSHVVSGMATFQA